MNLSCFVRRFLCGIWVIFGKRAVISILVGDLPMFLFLIHFSDNDFLENTKDLHRSPSDQVKTMQNICPSGHPLKGCIEQKMKLITLRKQSSCLKHEVW